MKKFALSLLLLSFGLFLMNPKLIFSQNTGSGELELLYQSAIGDAMQADSSEVCDSLWAIDNNNTSMSWKKIDGSDFVLMGCFTRFPDSFRDSIMSNTWGVLWVFIPQQFSRRMKQDLNVGSDTLLRVRQLLGLPPENQNSSFILFWVKSDALFRPAADPTVQTQSTPLFLDRNVDQQHSNWFCRNIYDSYFSSARQFPWTRLGYTYDWAKGANEIGISEYCLRPNSVIRVQGIYSSSLFFKLKL